MESCASTERFGWSLLCATSKDQYVTYLVSRKQHSHSSLLIGSTHLHSHPTALHKSFLPSQVPLKFCKCFLFQVTTRLLHFAGIMKINRGEKRHLPFIHHIIVIHWQLLLSIIIVILVYGGKSSFLWISQEFYIRVLHNKRR